MAWRLSGRAGGTLGQEPHVFDAAVLGLLEPADFGLAHHRRAVFKGGLQLHVGVGHGQNPARDGQDLAHPGHGLVEGVGDAVEGGQNQVAEGLPRQTPRVLGEAVRQQLRHDGLGVGQRLHTVADVPRRGHSQVLAQHAGPAAVVGHGDDGGQVFGIALQSPQHGAQARPAADGDNPRPKLPPPVCAAIGFGHLHTPKSIGKRARRARAARGRGRRLIPALARFARAVFPLPFIFKLSSYPCGSRRRCTPSA